MKYVCLFVSVFFFTGTLCAQQQKKWVVLEGEARNFNNQVQVEDLSELNELSLPDPDHFFVPDMYGNFRVRFRLDAPGYFRLGRNILYLSPGDSLYMFVDYKDPRIASFAGTHSEENNYLRETPFPKGGSFLEAGRLIRSTVDSTVTAIHAAAEARALSLKGYKLLDKEFVRLETARIKADEFNSLSGIEFYFPYVRKLSKDSTETFQRNFSQAIGPYTAPYHSGFIEPEFLKLAVYRDVIDELLSHEKQNTENVTQVKGWIAARELAQQLKKASDREAKIKLASEVKSVKNPAYKTALAKTLNKVLLLSNGDIAADFTVLDQDNKTIKLSELKGKVLYVDLWATWCGPCLAEMPLFDKLKESYKNDPRIRFISLSIDDDKQAWKTNMSKRNAAGLQWIIDRAKLQPYNIISIPRSILIDTEFKVVDMNAPLPSSKNITGVLNALLK